MVAHVGTSALYPLNHHLPGLSQEADTRRMSTRPAPPSGTSQHLLVRPGLVQRGALICTFQSALWVTASSRICLIEDRHLIYVPLALIKQLSTLVKCVLFIGAGIGYSATLA